MQKGNIYENVPSDTDHEAFEVIASNENVKIERITSRGQSSPESGWYDQGDHEWVIVLKGAAGLLFEDGTEVELGVGDYLLIQPHEKHRVVYTSAETETIWLAMHYK